MGTYPKEVLIEEQGLRDGLQSEKTIVATEKKLELINAVVAAGLKRVQVTSFVHPELVPQLADAEEVCKGLKQTDGVIFTGLVLNTKGIERAANAGLKNVEASISASDTHSRKNAHASLKEARKRFAQMVKAITDLANELCNGALVFSLEGGYNLTALAASVKATFDVLLGNTVIDDPLGQPTGRLATPNISQLIKAVQERHGLR